MCESGEVQSSNPDSDHEQEQEQKYCRTCGSVDPARGFHPESGPTDHCPNGGFDHALFDSKARMIEVDHENALLEAGKELTYL